jgi:hypothetical protein
MSALVGFGIRGRSMGLPTCCVGFVCVCVCVFLVVGLAFFVWFGWFRGAGQVDGLHTSFVWFLVLVGLWFWFVLEVGMGAIGRLKAGLVNERMID